MSRFFRPLPQLPCLLVYSFFIIAVTFSTYSVEAASFATANFIVHTSDPRLARRFAEAAEAHRYRLAIEWLGHPLPDWSKPCPITAHVGPHLGAGGATSFVFDQGEVFGWRMTVQGSEERIIDSVLPHEITHMILASYFRRPVPRWADEGAATSVEHPSERAKYHRMLNDYLRGGRTIPLAQLFRMQEYPPNMLVLYAQGYFLAEFLIQQGGRQKFVAFLKTAMDRSDWEGALAEHYGYRNLGDFYQQWLAWVQQGARPLRPATEVPLPQDRLPQFASGKLPRPSPNLIHYVRPGESLPPVGPPMVVAAAPLVAVDENLTGPERLAGEKEQGLDLLVAGELAEGKSPAPSGVKSPAELAVAGNLEPAADWSRPFTPGSIRVPEMRIYGTGVHVSLPLSTQLPRQQVIR